MQKALKIMPSLVVEKVYGKQLDNYRNTLNKVRYKEIYDKFCEECGVKILKYGKLNYCGLTGCYNLGYLKHAYKNIISHNERQTLAKIKLKLYNKLK